LSTRQEHKRPCPIVKGGWTILLNQKTRLHNTSFEQCRSFP
jgi:hypothetical protein